MSNGNSNGRNGSATAASGIERGQFTAAGDGRLRLAMQRSGRLTDDSFGLLRGAGIDFESYGQRLFSACRNFPMSLLYGRDDDIPEYLESGTVDLGIVGRNLLYEENVDVVELMPLGFGYCQLVLAVPEDAALDNVQRLDGSKIATSYPNSARRYFAQEGLNVEIVTLSGSVEMAPALGLAAAIVELTATGSTLLLHDLKIARTILESEAVLAANRVALADPQKRANIERLLLRLRASQAAKRFKYIMFNAPAEALPAIRLITPGLKSPTVVPLDDPRWVAVHTVIAEEQFWEIIEQLRDAGASEILVSPLEKLLL